MHGRRRHCKEISWPRKFRYHIDPHTHMAWARVREDHILYISLKERGHTTLQSHIRCCLYESELSTTIIAYPIELSPRNRGNIGVAPRLISLSYTKIEKALNWRYD